MTLDEYIELRKAELELRFEQMRLNRKYSDLDLFYVQWKLIDTNEKLIFLEKNND